MIRSVLVLVSLTVWEAQNGCQQLFVALFISLQPSLSHQSFEDFPMAKKKQSATKNHYDVHPSIAYVRAVLDNVPEKTGRSLVEWVELIRKEGLKGEKDRREWLKKEHKIG